MLPKLSKKTIRQYMDKFGWQLVDKTKDIDLFLQFQEVADAQYNLIVEHLKSPEKVREEVEQIILGFRSWKSSEHVEAGEPNKEASNRATQILQIVNAQKVIEEEEVKKILDNAIQVGNTISIDGLARQICQLFKDKEEK